MPLETKSAGRGPAFEPPTCSEDRLVVWWVGWEREEAEGVVGQPTNVSQKCLPGGLVGVDFVHVRGGTNGGKKDRWVLLGEGSARLSAFPGSGPRINSPNLLTGNAER